MGDPRASDRAVARPIESAEELSCAVALRGDRQRLEVLPQPEHRYQFDGARRQPAAVHQIPGKSEHYILRVRIHIITINPSIRAVPRRPHPVRSAREEAV